MLKLILKKSKLFILISALAMLVSCSNIPLTTMIRMINLNPLETNPSEFIVAVKTPQGIAVQEGDIVVDFSFRTDDPNVSFAHSFPVIVDNNYAIPDDLKEDLSDDEKITIMKLSAQDAVTMSQGQQAVKAYRKKYENKGAGSMNVRLLSACRNDDFSWQNTELDVYLKTDSDDDFFLFLENMDINELDNDIQRRVNTVPNCE
ncbi:hypothetical protein [Idiomarina xiamenensis]|uniref:Lipoprotein n=1 Tax=Idiomarina xiamenensis 10-D-4 TaxID=740709 RepID=K2KA60_9GAMM|nr:hypothetical protein [Idiomarina xiamenensis]EKE83432.1 hypothetical protein A10D4_08422 [Idiomarina xiamenensis 10-D-4]